MGASGNPIMLFNLDDLVQPVEGLEKLVLPFSHEEIDKVVQNMPSDKAPGPDGFNRKFLTACSHIVKNDFYKLCQEFYENAVDLKRLNSSFIALIPKANNSVRVNDFRPISFLSIS
jgi:hypothetical protein